MKDQLLLLLELQTIDHKVRELETARQAVPGRTATLRADLAKLEAMLDGERHKLAEAETLKQQHQATITREQDLLRAAKSKLSGTRTGKEFHAASREVEFKRKSISDRESELKKLTETLGASSAAISERDAAISGLRERLATEETQVQNLVAELDAQIAEVGAGRADVRGRLDKSWLKTYDALIVRGTAVAPVEGGVCQGCRVKILPQQNNKLARLETIETCERCGRIIYRKEMLAPPAEAEAAPSA